MADPTKEEELKKMLQMIVGKIYADMTGKDPSEFDPRSLGKTEDAHVGPHPDWNPKDGELREYDWELQLFGPKNTPLTKEVYLEQQRLKAIQKRKDALKRWRRHRGN